MEPACDWPGSGDTVGEDQQFSPGGDRVRGHYQRENQHGPSTGHLGAAGVGVQRHPRRVATRDGAVKWAQENHRTCDLPFLLKIGDRTDTWLLTGWCASEGDDA
jgi:hypothetical protein